MERYLKGYNLYSFNCQRAFGAKHIAKNSLASKNQQKYNEKIVQHRGNILTKS